MPRYKNVSGQAVMVMTIKDRKKKVIKVLSDEEFESDRETTHIRNMIAQKLLRRVES